MNDDIETLRGLLRGFGLEALERLVVDRDSLRKALDERHAADKKAWSAIMRATGKERGLPDNKEVIAFYVAEVERLEKERDDAREAIKTQNGVVLSSIEKTIEARKKLPCGHHASSLISSVESDAQFCEVCDLMAQRDDAREAIKTQNGVVLSSIEKTIEARKKLPCGHHASSLISSVESDAQFCEVCDLMAQRDDAVAMEEAYRTERDSLRAKLDRAKEAMEAVRKEDKTERGWFRLHVDSILAELSADAPAHQCDVTGMSLSGGGGWSSRSSPHGCRIGGGGSHRHIIYEHEVKAETIIDHPGRHENAPAQREQVMQELADEAQAIGGYDAPAQQTQISDEV